MKPGDFDVVAVSKALRAIGLDVCPSLYLDPPVYLEKDKYAVPTIGRMCFEAIGTKEVRWTGKQWEVAKGWLSRVDPPQGETVFDEKLTRLVK